MKKSTGSGRRSSKRSRGVSGRSRVSGWSAGLTVTGGGSGVVAYAGAGLLRLLADRVGLTGGLSQAMGGARNGRGHDRGRVLVDVAVGMASGLDTIRRMDVLSGQQELFAEMASRSTRSRVLGGEVDDDRLAAVGLARAASRAGVWALAEQHGGIPPARVPGGDLGDVIVLRVDTNPVEAFSGKEGAAGQRGVFGFQPMSVICDNTAESLVNRLRRGDAGTRDADDHIDALTEAIFTQLPPGYRQQLLVTADGAGCSHKLVGWLQQLNRDPDPASADPGMQVDYSIGWRLDKATGPAVAGLPEQAWTPMLLKDGKPGAPAQLDQPSAPDTVGEVAEITHLLPHLTSWPPGIRVIARRVKPLRGTDPTPLPGAGQQLEIDGITAAAVTGWRYDLFATNSTHPDIAWLDGVHRAHARVEDGIRVGKQIGAAKYPFHGFTANAAWLTVHGIAADLLAWLRLLACHRDLAAAEPRTLQDRILHAPARLTRSGRRPRLAFPPGWPWTPHIVAIFNRIQTLPAAHP